MAWILLRPSNYKQVAPLVRTGGSRHTGLAALPHRNIHFAPQNRLLEPADCINLISGAYTLPLIDKLFSNSQRIENMDDVYFAITALVDTDRISEAFHMIRGLFGISGMEYPQEIAQLEKSEELQESFVSEYIFDFYDVIEDKRIETEEQEIPV